MRGGENVTSQNVNDIMKSLRMVNKTEAIEKKYEYINKGKKFRNKQDFFKSAIIIVTIIITLITISVSAMVGFSNNIVNIHAEASNFTKETLLIKGDIESAEKKLGVVLKDRLELIQETFESMIDVVIFFITICIILGISSLIISRVYGDRASEYETLVKYIEDELLH